MKIFLWRIGTGMNFRISTGTGMNLILRSFYIETNQLFIVLGCQSSTVLSIHKKMHTVVVIL